MLPPLDPSLLHDNPKFAIFHRRLTALLDDDGSIKPRLEETERRATLQQVYDADGFASSPKMLCSTELSRRVSSQLRQMLRKPQSFAPRSLGSTGLICLQRFVDLESMLWR